MVYSLFNSFLSFSHVKCSDVREEDHHGTKNKKINISETGTNISCKSYKFIVPKQWLLPSILSSLMVPIQVVNQNPYILLSSRYIESTLEILVPWKV
jgi:hypothetical protein